ncbi:MAG: hypothetical protein HDR88_04310 [Bacteroides sp.]|nr:hypothetical protein [Bacteroides sp.]
MRSFLESMQDNVATTPEQMFSNWVATMIDRKLSDASRRRYFGVLSALYKEYLSSQNDTPDSEFLTNLRNFMVDTEGPIHATRMVERLRKVFGMVINDARHQPELALFLYMLLNASSDLTGAISLTVENYQPEFPQLDSVIDINTFHHRRRYVFDLGQSRKRMPQLYRETLVTIESYLMTRGIRFPQGFSVVSILSLWVAMARKVGIPLSEIRTAISEVPDDFSYLSLVPPTASNPDNSDPLTQSNTDIVKRTVAEAFSPSCDHWHAMKLRRGTSFADISEKLTEVLPDVYRATSFFYPEREYVKKTGKKIVREMVPVLPDIVFFRVQARYVADIDRTLRYANMAWVFRTVNTPDSDYSMIDNASMLTFERAIGQLTPDMKVELTDKRPIAIGREVRITGGVLTGYRGIVYDIKPSNQNPTISTPINQIFIRLSSSDFMKIEVAIPEEFIEEVDSEKIMNAR